MNETVSTFVCDVAVEFRPTAVDLAYCSGCCCFTDDVLRAVCCKHVRRAQQHWLLLAVPAAVSKHLCVQISIVYHSILLFCCSGFNASYANFTLPPVDVVLSRLSACQAVNTSLFNACPGVYDSFSCLSCFTARG